jgi:hypothetical protein
MVKCTRAGRERAFTKVNNMLGPGAVLESRHLNGRTAIWSILKPREHVINLDGSWEQDCVVVEYIVVGEIPARWQVSALDCGRLRFPIMR